MSICRRFLSFRTFLPLLAAGSFAACGSDPSDFGEPFSLSASDAGTEQASGNAGNSSEGAGANAAGSGGSAAGRGGSGGSSVDAGAGRDDDDDHDDDDDAKHDDDDDKGNAGRAGSGGVGPAAGSGGAGGSNSAAVSFSDIFTGTIAAGCSCHNDGAGGLNLGTRAAAYKNLVSVASGSCTGEQRVVPGKPESSVLLHAVSHTTIGSCKAPNMPQGGRMLTQTQLDQISAWIAAGAPDN